MIRSTVATVLTVVACAPPAPAPAPSPVPTQPERAIIETPRPPKEADEGEPTEPPEPLVEPWTADRLAPFVKPSCHSAHATKASRVRASTCFGADVLELPRVRTQDVLSAACGDVPCDDTPPSELVDHDLACWRDPQRPDHTMHPGANRCWCDEVAVVAGEPMLFCQRTWLHDGSFTTMVLYRLRGGRWTLALERIILGFDLDTGDTAELQIWVAGDQLVLAGSKCALATLPSSMSARICEHAGIYRLENDELTRVGPQPRCAAGLMPPPPAPRRRPSRLPPEPPWYYYPMPPPPRPSTGLADECPAADQSR